LILSIPIKTYFLLAFLTVATMGLSNASVAHLNYPTQVMFKCCKLIPVMIGGILIQGKRYNIFDVSACLSMTIGLIFFTLADQKVQPDFKMLGVALVSGALCADAVIGIYLNFIVKLVVYIILILGNVQEKQMKLHKASNVEVVRIYIELFIAFSHFVFFFKKVLYSYGIGFFYVLIGEILFDDLIDAFTFWSKVVFVFVCLYYANL
jgi:adenosine 3'-phospho 5'-phosphosulfate transporter B3